MPRKPIKYCVVDAFTDSPFKGNPAAVCLLEEARGKEWLQAVAREFNISETCYVTEIHNTNNKSDNNGTSNPRFSLRWFTPLLEMKLCGHATLAAAYVLFTCGVVKSNMVEFSTLSGILTARKVVKAEKTDGSNGNAKEQFLIELDFPTATLADCSPSEIPSIPLTLNGAQVIGTPKMASTGDIIVELSSGTTVADLQPYFSEMQKCSGRGLAVTGAAPTDSGFDFYSRFFSPKLGVDEDPVCGSAHCALAPYWSKKLGKSELKAYMASARGGILDLQLNKETQRLLIRGKAVIVMEGSIYA